MKKMKLLAIETSCDETAIAIVEAVGDETSATFQIQGDALLSQIELHRPYGGVFPNLAKREHAKNIIPLTRAALEESGLLHQNTNTVSTEKRNRIASLFTHDQDLAEQFFDFVTEVEPPEIDAIAVTACPGLEPALWVGVNTAKAFSIFWDKPLVAVNHMEGHILSALAKTKNNDSTETPTLEISNVELPVLALLISGGHTELTVMRKWLSYELIGETRDDAVGEAFDKVARLLGLPYPGGPEISKLAENVRASTKEKEDGDLPAKTSDKQNRREQEKDAFVCKLPRPMIQDQSCDFSFAGLKTATRYLIQDLGEINDSTKSQIALDFENAVADVLLSKTLRGLKETGAKTLVLGGGVSANKHICEVFTKEIAHTHPEVSLKIPQASLTTDNAIMIALAGFYRASRHEYADTESLTPSGSKSLAKKPTNTAS